MSNTITIVGRIATTYLARGETATVERTDLIDGLIAGGYVAPSGDGALVGAAYPPETSEAADEATGLPGDTETVEPPARNASRGAWRDFLTAQVGDVDEDATRDELVEMWHGTR